MSERAPGSGERHIGLTLYCESRDKLQRLYDRSLKERRMILPPSATDIRGPIRVCITLPSGDRMLVGGNVSVLRMVAGVLLRLEFDDLRPDQHELIRKSLHVSTGVRVRDSVPPDSSENQD